MPPPSKMLQTITSRHIKVEKNQRKSPKSCRKFQAVPDADKKWHNVGKYGLEQCCLTLEYGLQEGAVHSLGLQVFLQPSTPPKCMEHSPDVKTSCSTLCLAGKVDMDEGRTKSKKRSGEWEVPRTTKNYQAFQDFLSHLSSVHFLWLVWAAGLFYRWSSPRPSPFPIDSQLGFKWLALFSIRFISILARSVNLHIVKCGCLAR